MEDELNVKIRQIDKFSKSQNRTTTNHKQAFRLSRKELCDKLKVETISPKQRSSSLTETVKNRKSVTFADNHGIGVDIRVYDSNVPPEVPDYVLSDLKKFRSHTPSPDIIPNFTFTHNFVSIDEVNVEEIMRIKTVCLYRLVIMEDIIYGMINVSNIAPDKLVFVRFTTNRWTTFTDYDAIFCSTRTSTIDQFSFQICVSSICCVFGALMEFAICYKCAGQEFWDNNNNNNYKVIKSISQN